MPWSRDGPDETAPLPPCPKCGGTEIVPVVFGLPGEELMERARRGEVALGGCMPLPGILGACTGCGEWRRRGRAP